MLLATMLIIGISMRIGIVNGKTELGVYWRNPKYAVEVDRPTLRPHITPDSVDYVG